MAVKFEIHRDGRRLDAFQPVAAMAIGPESVPISGEVRFRDGLLVVERQDDFPLGVALLWELPGGAGTYHLETTRLPHRDQPYVLNVELARARLMKILQKHEDWSLFDFPKAEPLNQRLKEIQLQFADALAQTDDRAAAAATGDRVLAAAIALSEEIARFHADILLTRRRGNGQLPRALFGVRVDSSVQNQKYRDSVSNFDYAVVPMPWRRMQPAEGTFNTDAVDEWIEGLSRKRVPVVAGPLIRLDESDVPDWMFIWEHDYDTLREMAYEHVQKLVARYRRGVAVWNVVAGLHANKAFHLTFEQMIELTRLLTSQVKAAIPQSRVLISVTQPFGEYHARHAQTVPPMLYAEMVAQAGINFEGFGLELEMGVPTDGAFTRDLFQLSAMLDRFSTLGRPLFITALSAPGKNSTDPSDVSRGKFDPAAAGQWRRPWDPELQAEWMQAVYELALSKPYVESIAWGNLADLNPTVPAGGLFNDMLQPKVGLARLLELKQAFAKR